mmetsp:Transcript_9673/g.30674  ORF Transcript_9673/g.30674 Transcript_9673/m.30674 type:complete len:90 (+) Transcript_9673:432-701(+)
MSNGTAIPAFVCEMTQMSQMTDDARAEGRAQHVAHEHAGEHGGRHVPSIASLIHSLFLSCRACRATTPAVPVTFFSYLFVREFSAAAGS